MCKSLSAQFSAELLIPLTSVCIVTKGTPVPSQLHVALKANLMKEDSDDMDRG